MSPKSRVCLAAVDIFADAAREQHPFDPAEIEDRIGQVEMLDRMRHRPLGERGNEFVGHGLGHLVELGEVDDVALVPVEAGLACVVAAGGIEPLDPAACIHHLQAAADMDGGGLDHEALLDDGKLGGAAADVDVEHALAFLVRHLGGA
jgi:hypothetical protein